MSRHNARAPSKNPIERTFANLDRLLERVVEQRWNHRAFGRLNDRGAYDSDDKEATSEADDKEE